MPRPDTCCLCGQVDDEGEDTARVAWCPLCEHDFCELCRELFFDRGLAAMKEFLTRRPPAHCRGHEEAR